MRELLGRHDDVAGAARGVDVLVIATTDAALAEVSARVVPVPGTVVLHLSGALGLDVLATHPRRASLHPLVPLPSAEVGRVRLRSGITFAVAGDPVAAELAGVLGGSVVVVDDEHRPAYHAAACIASNHLVALMGQVERVAASAGLDLDTFLGLARAAMTDVAELGPVAALTGPAARGDEATLERHRLTLDASEVPGYDAGVALARRLVAQRPAAAGPAARPAAHGAPDARRAATGRRTPRRADRAALGAKPALVGTGGQGARRPRRAAAVRVVHSAAQFSAALDAERALGRSVGLVPTMGALHAGHRSLVERAVAECDIVAVTVFVNPLQFNDAADLAAYPRDLDADVALARSAGASVVFAPPVEEMYPAPSRRAWRRRCTSRA